MKPPKPPPPKGRKKRNRGGQPGHRKHERAAFPPGEVEEVLTYKMRRCPKTGRRSLERLDLPPRTKQQVGPVKKPYVVREHRAYGYWCADCEEGVLGSDFFPAYKKNMKDFNVVLQLCLAYLIREVKFLSGHPDAQTAAYGKRFLSALKELFGVIHRRETTRALGVSFVLTRCPSLLPRAANPCGTMTPRCETGSSAWYCR